jgi:MAP/microtubule affinity-regulating kinase
MIRRSTDTREIKGYLIQNQIGQGAYAIVKQAINTNTKEKVAIKIYEKYRITDTQRKASVNREISLLKRLTHTNIVKLYESIDMPRQLWLVMELAFGRSLHSFLRAKSERKLSEKDGMRVFRQVLSGIEYCHKMNVTHRDIKMENILVDDELNVKIIDFGFSVCSPPTQKLRIFCGTPSYMAPEIVNKEKYLGPPTDVWSLGILLFTLLAGHFPFRGVTEKDLFRSISRGIVTYPTGISEEVKILIGKMLQVNPLKRATATEVTHCNN